MNNEEMRKKMEFCIKEYQKIKEKNELLEEKIDILEENNSRLISCLQESGRIINVTKDDLQNSIDVINDLKRIVDYYEGATISIIQQLESKVAEIIKKEEDTKEIQEAIAQVKEEIINLNNIII